MNEYTFEIWQKMQTTFANKDYEFDSMYACLAENAVEAMLIAKDKAKNMVMRDVFSYQVRNLKKL